VRLSSVGGGWSIAALSWNPDGDSLLIGLERYGYSHLRWIQYGLSDGRETLLASPPVLARQPTYYGSLYISDLNGYTSPSERYTLNSRDAETGGRELWLVDNTGNLPSRLLLKGLLNETIREARWSAGETLVAFDWGPLEFGRSFFVHDIATGETTSLAEELGFDYPGVVQWNISPGGGQIAATDYGTLWILDSAGRRVLEIDEPFYSLVWTHDGGALVGAVVSWDGTRDVFQVERVDIGAQQLCVDLSDGDLLAVKEAGIEIPSLFDVSPDGSSLVFWEPSGDIAIATLTDSRLATSCSAIR
jgi:hypothetical protein